MPLYEYECQACHRRTEKIQKFSDPELTECPHCKGRLERTITAPSFQFAGGGWYKDLYSSAKPAESSSSGSESSAGASADGGTPSATPAAASAAPAAAPAASTAASTAAPAASKS